MATIGPSAENVALIGHEHAGVPNGIAALRGRRIRQILADRLPVQPQSTGDGGLVHALVGYALDGSEALLRLALDAFPRGFAVHPQVRQRVESRISHCWREDLPDQPRMALEDAAEHLPQVVQQVKAVCDLSHLGRDALCGVGIFTAAIPAYDLDTQMSGQPGRELVASAVRKQIDRSMSLQIDQNAAVGPSPAEGKVVHAEHAGSRKIRKAIRAQVRQHGIPAGGYAQLVEQSSSWFTSRSKGQMHQPRA